MVGPDPPGRGRTAGLINPGEIKSSFLTGGEVCKVDVGGGLWLGWTQGMRRGWVY